MGRKRNQGKARKAANAKAREEVKEMGNNNQTTNGTGLSLAGQIQLLRAVTTKVHAWNKESHASSLHKGYPNFRAVFSCFHFCLVVLARDLGSLSLSRGSLVS